MHFILIAGIVLGLTVVVKLFRSFRRSLRQKARAELLGCKPPIRAISVEPSGIAALFRGLKASNELRFPDYIVEQFVIIREREGRPAGTIQHTAPFFKSVIFTSDPQNLQTMLATKFQDFGLGVNRTLNFRPLLGNGIVSRQNMMRNGDSSRTITDTVNSLPPTASNGSTPEPYCVRNSCAVKSAISTSKKPTSKT